MWAVCSGALAYWTLAPLTRSAQSDSSYPTSRDGLRPVVLGCRMTPISSNTRNAPG